MLNRFTISICAVALQMSATARADEAAWRERVHLGAGLGATFTTLGGSELDDQGLQYSYRGGYTIVGHGSLQLVSSLALQSGIRLAVKGDRVDTAFESTSSTLDLVYLELPVLLRAGASIVRPVDVYGHAGIAVGFLVDADRTQDDGRHTENNNRFNTIDIGLLLGAGVAVAVGERRGEVTLDVSHVYGLRERVRRVSSTESFNRAIYVTVGYRADLATLGRLLGGRGDGKRPAEEAPRKPDPPPAAVESTPVPPSPAPGGPDS